MKCPFCGSEDTQVVDTRANLEANTIRRRRKCVACEKRFEGRVPKTEYRLSTKGRAALTRYLDHMEALIRATRAGRGA